MKKNKEKQDTEKSSAEDREIKQKMRVAAEKVLDELGKSVEKWIHEGGSRTYFLVLWDFGDDGRLNEGTGISNLIKAPATVREAFTLNALFGLWNMVGTQVILSSFETFLSEYHSKSSNRDFFERAEDALDGSNIGISVADSEFSPK